MERGLIIVLLGLILLPITTSAYTDTGTIRENGDEYWDDSEYTSYEYRLETDQLLSAEVSVDSGILFVFLGYVNSEKGIEAALEDILFYGYSDQVIDSGVADETDDATLSYVPRAEDTVYVTIFSYTGYQLSMSYKLTSNLDPYTVDFTWVWIVLGIILVAGVGYVIYDSKKPKAPNRGRNQISNVNQNSYLNFNRNSVIIMAKSEGEIAKAKGVILDQQYILSIRAHYTSIGYNDAYIDAFVEGFISAFN